MGENHRPQVVRRASCSEEGPTQSGDASSYKHRACHHEAMISETFMSTGLVDALHQWFIEHEERLSSAGVIVEFTEVANEDARSARIDLESGSKLGRATVWEDGFCDFETINTKTD